MESTAPEGSKKKKVLCPIQSQKDPSKTIWMKMGTAYVNRDNSINVYLDGLPVNGKLQVRDWDEKDERELQERRERRSFAGTGAASSNNNQEIPF